MLLKDHLEFVEKIEGWCSKEKAMHLADFAASEGVETSLELGIYCGKSLLATAGGFIHKKKGMAWGVDSWRLDPCLVGFPKDAANWEKVNFSKIYYDFISNYKFLNCFEHCNWIRATSQEAFGFFEKFVFDLLHVDSNHGAETNLWEIEHYFSLVRSGGIIVLDDIDWESVTPCLQYVQERCGTPFLNYGEWAAFRKP